MNIELTTRCRTGQRVHLGKLSFAVLRTLDNTPFLANVFYLSWRGYPLRNSLLSTEKCLSFFISFLFSLLEVFCNSLQLLYFRGFAGIFTKSKGVEMRR